MQETNPTRLATEEDIPSLVKMSMDFHATSTFAEFGEADESKLEEFIKSLIDLQPTGQTLVLVLDLGSGPQGMIVATSNEVMFSRDKIATELAWWIDPEVRGGGYSKILLEGYEYWSANIAKCKYRSMSSLMSYDIDTFLTNRGYMPVEASFLQVI